MSKTLCGTYKSKDIMNDVYILLEFPICIGGQYSNIMELNFKPAQWLKKNEWKFSPI